MNIGLSKYSDFISPFLIACSTRNAKYSATAVQCLHTLINFEGLPSDRMPEVLDAFKEATHLGVEIQLKILQSLPSLIQNYGDFMFDNQIVELLLICYILQSGNKAPVVVNTALATLQQLIISVFDKVVKEDSLEEPKPKTFEVPIDTNDMILVSPAAYDALRVFLDICNLIERQRPLFLEFGHLPETVGLELIESILTTHSDIFIEHKEFCYVLRTRTVPLLLRAFSEKRDYPVTVRVTRILYLLIRKQLSTLVVECEVILSLLTHMLEPDAASYWKRVLCMEVFQGVCSEFSLIQNIYSAYDFEDGRRAIVKNFVLALDKLSSEQPNTIGLGKASVPPVFPDESQLQHGSTSGGANSLDLSQVRGISYKTSTVRSSCIDLLDKSDPPSLPPSYLFYLVLQCLNSLSEGLARSVFASGVSDKQRKATNAIASKEAINTSRSRSPSPAGIQDPNEPVDDLFDKIVITTSFVGVCWPELISGYTTYFQATLDSELYRALVRSAQKFTHASGILGISDARDAFLSMIGKFSVTVADAVDSTPLASPKPGLLSMETLVGTLSPAMAREHSRTPSVATPVSTTRPVLTSRNILCFRALLNLGIALGPSLEMGWTILLETIQYASFIINGVNADKRRGSVSKSDSDYNIETNPLPFSHIGSEFQAVENSLRKLLDSSKEYSAHSFHDLMSSVIILSSLVLKIPSDTSKEDIVVAGIGSLTDCDPLFLLDFLGALCFRNSFRYTTSSEEEKATWDLLTEFLITAQTSRELNSDSRIRAAQVLNEAILKNFLVSDVHKEQDSVSSENAQALVLKTLTTEVAKVVELGLPSDGGTISLLSTESKLHVMAINNLNKILDHCGGTLTKGWDIIFDVIDTVFTWLPTGHENSEVQNRRLLNERSALLVKSGFDSLQLICNDFLENLPTSCFIRLMNTLYKFCHQEGDLNISFTSISFFWIISDNLRSILGDDIKVDLSKEVSTKKDLLGLAQESDVTDSLNALWMVALLKLADIAYDPRPQVRNGAIQILFRIFEAHGGQLPPRVWKACQFIVLEAVMSHNPFEGVTHTEEADAEWCETLGLEFAGLGNIFATFINIFVQEDHFESQWARMLDHLQKFSSCGRVNVSLSVYRALHTILEGVKRHNVAFSANCINRTWDFWTSQDITVTKQSTKTAQDAFTAFVDLHDALSSITSEFPEERITSTVNVLQKCATYPILPPYSSDKDHLSPLQSSALRRIKSISLDSFHNIREVLRLLAVLVALPFDDKVLGNIEEYSSQSQLKDQYRYPTFVSLALHALDYLQSSLQTAAAFPDIVIDGTATRLAKALLVSIDSKFDSYIIPAGKPQLWQIASSRFLELISLSIPVFANHDSNNEITQLWDLFADAGVGLLIPGFNALKSKTLRPELKTLQSDSSYEKFDMDSYATFMENFVSSEQHISRVAEVGVTVPDLFWKKILATLFQVSFIYEMPRFTSTSSSPVLASLHDSPDQPGILPPKDAINYIVSNTFFGSTDTLVSRPRQNCAYMSMETLGTLASPDSTQGNNGISTLATEYVTLRVALVLYLYITDQPLRGQLPMPKIQRSELINSLKLVSSIEKDGLLVPLFPLIVKAIPIAENDKPILHSLQALLLRIGQAKSIHP